MFRKNEVPPEPGPSSIQQALPEKLRKQLENSWAQTFRDEVLRRIDEEPFAVLYSNKPSRPNAPVNVLVSMEILKAGFGWSDEELYDHVCFDLQVRHALGLDEPDDVIFNIRTLYNFRKRVRDYAEDEGVNLMRQVFEQVTDEQLAAVGVATEWERMDSTQILSNIAAMTRLELLVAVIQSVYRQLDEQQQAQWHDRLAPYVDERPHNVCYKIPANEVDEHLAVIGQLLVALEKDLQRIAPDSDALILVTRVLSEQYERHTDDSVTLRSAEDVSATSLQSPHDLDATYREKGDTAYPGGYVANVSETADPGNAVQMIIDVEVAPNQTDDGDLLEHSLEAQDERGIEVEQVTVDGGYTGPTAEAACEEHDVELRATRMRGGTSDPDTWGWDEYTWTLDEDGTPRAVTCPEGETAELQPGEADDRYIARLDPDVCAQCPFFEKQCRVQPRVRVGPTFYLQQRTIEVALQRQRLCPEDASIRAVVEGTIRSLKWPFPDGKLPVRGLIRARMVIYAAALMVNVRRLHTYFTEQARNMAATAPMSGLYSVLLPLRAQYTRFHRMFSASASAIGTKSYAGAVRSA